MQISSSSNAHTQMPRTVTPAKSSSDRDSNGDTEVAVAETKAQERAQQQRQVEDNLQQRNEENQRRLDGRLISFGQEENSVKNEQTQASFNRSRVNDAYSPPSDTQKQSTQAAHQEESEAIDIVV